MIVGVIGLGSIGTRHAKNLDKLGHTVMGWDPNVSDWNYDTSLGQIIEQSSAIVIASPTKYHAQHILATNGRVPLFTEKPISQNLNLSAHNFSSVKMVGYNLRFHGSVKHTKAWLDSGKIGKPLWANFICGQYNDKPSYLLDGVILNWSHEIDLALYLLGDAHVEASSTRVVDGHDDMTDILLTHESGCRTTIHLDYITKPEIRTFTIAGTEGKISVSLPQRNAFLARHDRDQSDWLHCKKSYDEDYIDEMREFLRLVENPGTATIGCSAIEALKILEVCLDVRKRAEL